MDLFKKYYAIAVRFLSFRPRSEKEVRDNLFQKKAPPEIIDSIITILKKQRFLNDEHFVLWWREQRTKVRPRSDRFIKYELQQKGIKSELIETLFTKQEEKSFSDLEKAKRLVEKKLGQLKDLPFDQQYQKLGALLARRGFDWDTIQQAIDAYLQRRYNVK